MSFKGTPFSNSIYCTFWNYFERVTQNTLISGKMTNSNKNIFEVSLKKSKVIS